LAARAFCSFVNRTCNSVNGILLYIPLMLPPGANYFAELVLMVS
jgi:hypothetical protein